MSAGGFGGMHDGPGNRVPGGERESADRPLEVFAFDRHSGEDGSIVMYARRSRLDITPLEIRVNPYDLKQMMATWLVAESQMQQAQQGRGIQFLERVRPAGASS